MRGFYHVLYSSRTLINSKKVISWHAIELIALYKVNACRPLNHMEDTAY